MLTKASATDYAANWQTPSGGGGIAEAPTDGQQYGRVGSTATWTVVTPNPTWTTLSGKPATFPPTVPIAWTDVSGKPSTFPPTLPILESDVTNLVADLALKAPLASPVFTGDARAVTPATADNDTSVATTAFVRSAMSTYSAGATAQTRNRIVNGAMQISQENSNTAGTANAYYPADQWQLAVTLTVGAVSIQRVQVVTPNGSVNRIRLSVTTAAASLSAGDSLYLQQPVEGIRIADFRYGSAQAQQTVLRFGFKAPAGTYSICLRSPGASRAYVANFTVSAGQANTDTVQTFIIPGDTTGAWQNDTNIGFYLRVAVAAGSANLGVAGWQGGFPFGTSSNTNGMATIGNIFELFDVGLYLDANATGLPPAWQMPDEAQELAACQRYWNITVTQYSGATVSAVAYRSFTTTIPCAMRQHPH